MARISKSNTNSRRSELEAKGMIAPWRQRFKDERETRDRGYYRKDVRRESKEMGVRHRKLFEAWRKDKRFAIFPLYSALMRDNFKYGETYSKIGDVLDKHKRYMRLGPTWRGGASINGDEIAFAAAHVALVDPTKVACYPSRADAERRREVVMSAGKFFTATRSTTHTDAQIKDLAEAHIAAEMPTKVFFVDNSKFDDADELGNEWVRVYRNPRGFSSCMGSFDDTPLHPARFYALPGNGLSLAYITHNNKPRGAITARAICNLEAKAYVRNYGDARLATALESQYKLEHDPEAALNNVDCRIINRRGYAFVAPYVDGEMSAYWDGSTDYCTLTTDEDAPYYLQETEGFATKRGCECDSCEERADNDELQFSRHHDQHLCEFCRQEHYHYAIARDGYDWIEKDQTVEINEEYYLDDTDFLESRGFVFSNYSNEWMRERDAVFIESSNQYVFKDDAVRLDILHGEDEYALEENSRIIQLHGKILRVHVEYSGEEDKEVAVCTKRAAKRTTSKSTKSAVDTAA